MGWPIFLLYMVLSYLLSNEELPGAITATPCRYLPGSAGHWSHLLITYNHFTQHVPPVNNWHFPVYNY